LEDLLLPGPLEQPLYSKYTFTDISSAFFVAAKEHFRHHHNIEYRVLDISKDHMEQGFNGEKYDLILATNVIHATKSLGDSLTNMRKLLGSQGRLLLHELYSHSKWPNFIFGTLPGWWYGERDGRPEEPCVAPARWEAELRRAGFSGLDAVVLDGEEPHQLNAIMVAKPQVDPAQETKKAVTILCDQGENHADALSRRLQSRGYVVHQCWLGEELPASQGVISLLDCRGPFLEDINEGRYKAFQSLLDNLSESGMLWITHPCQVQCRDPRYAQMIGAARTIRTETLLDFATCEVDDISSSLDRIADVFAVFQARVEDESLKPDYEYALIKGAVQVGRYYPFSLKEELLPETMPGHRKALDIVKPGRLTSLQWIPRDKRALNDNEVEVQVYAAGLNFKVRPGPLASRLDY
jgi:hypothetical protein